MSFVKRIILITMNSRRKGPVMQTWWRHQMEKLSVLLALSERNPPVTSGFPSQGPATRSFDVFFDLRLKKTTEQTIDTPVILDAIVLIMASLLCNPINAIMPPCSKWKASTLAQ